MLKVLLNPNHSINHGRKSLSTPRLLDEAEEERQVEMRREMIQKYRRVRGEMSDRREHDCKLRNSLKALQLRLYEQLQASLQRCLTSFTDSNNNYYY